jgi:ribosomal protein S10
LPTEDGGLYHIVADVSFTLEDGTQIVYFYGEQSIVSTESSAVSTDDQSFLDVVTSNIEIVAAIVVAAVAVTGGGDSGGDGNDDGEDDENTNTFFIDTGSSNSDGITNNNTITVNNLEAGETWQYSIDSGVNFIDGKGNSFMLSDDTYAANVIQIRKLDAAGVTLSVTNVNETSSIVIDTTKSMFTSSTAVNVKTDTPASTIIYTAETDEEKVTYTLKDGNQKEKFTIDNATGELKYKKEQTQVSVHKVTIIATDVAGNETEQLITVSMKSDIRIAIIIYFVD